MNILAFTVNILLPSSYLYINYRWISSIMCFSFSLGTQLGWTCRHTSGTTSLYLAFTWHLKSQYFTDSTFQKQFIHKYIHSLKLNYCWTTLFEFKVKREILYIIEILIRVLTDLFSIFIIKKIKNIIWNINNVNKNVHWT